MGPSAPVTPLVADALHRVDVSAEVIAEAVHRVLLAHEAGRAHAEELTGPMLQRWRLLDRYRVYLLEARHRTPRTYAEYRRTLLDFWAHAGKEPDQVTARDLHRFLYDRRLAPSTRKTYAAHVKAFSRWAAAHQFLPSDPLVDYATPPAPLGPPRSLSLPDVWRLVRFAYSQPRLHLCVWLAYGAGLRCCEVAALKIEDCQPSGPRPYLRVRGKGDRERIVHLHPDVAWVLGCALVGRAGAGPVVESEVDPGQPIGAKHVSRLLNQALHGLRPPLRATAHQLRHTFATELLAAGATERAIGLLLGHADPKSTRRYTQAYDADAFAAAQLLPTHPGDSGDSGELGGSGGGGLPTTVVPIGELVAAELARLANGDVPPLG